jgi:hypothetical protein
MDYAPADTGESTEEGFLNGGVDLLRDGFGPPSEMAIREEDYRPYAPLVSLEDIAEVKDTVFESWFSQDGKLDVVYNLLFSVMDEPSVYAEFRFLALAQALELFHRRMLPGMYLEENEFADVHATLTEAIPGSVPSNVRKAFEGKLTFINEFSLRKRLKQLLNQCDDAIKRAILGLSDKEVADLSDEEFLALLKRQSESFISDTVAIRNYLTHYTNEPHGGVPGPHKLAGRAAQMRRLLTAMLFQQLGIPSDTITKAIGRIEPVPLHWH